MEKPPSGSPRRDEQGYGVAAFDHGELAGEAGAEDGGESLEKKVGRKAAKVGGESGGGGFLAQPTNLSSNKRLRSQGKAGNGLVRFPS